MTMKLVIGDYSKSSWSFRAWLVLETAGAAFETVQVKLEESDTHQNILKYSPSGKVPALMKDGIVINDSLAIVEAAAEAFPHAHLWPDDARLRALARSAVAEMHSGFTNLRTQMSFGLGTGEQSEPVWPETQWEIQRVFQIWRNLKQTGGPNKFLCGEFGIVDAMFAPVVFRFRRFDIPIPPDLQEYVAAVLAYPPVKKWLGLAANE